MMVDQIPKLCLLDRLIRESPHREFLRIRHPDPVADDPVFVRQKSRRQVRLHRTRDTRKARRKLRLRAFCHDPVQSRKFCQVLLTKRRDRQKNDISHHFRSPFSSFALFFRMPFSLHPAVSERKGGSALGNSLFFYSSIPITRRQVCIFREISNFFENSKVLQEISVEIGEYHGKEDAIRVIEECKKAYLEHQE